MTNIIARTIVVAVPRAHARLLLAAVSTDDTRDTLTRAWTCEVAGARWIVSTDGHRGHMIPCPGGVPDGTWTIGRVDLAAALKAAGRSAVAVDLRLTEWLAGDPQPPPFSQVVPAVDGGHTITVDEIVLRAFGEGKQRPSGRRIVLSPAVTWGPDVPAAFAVVVQGATYRKGDRDLTPSTCTVDPVYAAEAAAGCDAVKWTVYDPTGPTRFDRPDGAVAIVMPYRI